MPLKLMQCEKRKGSEKTPFYKVKTSMLKLLNKITVFFRIKLFNLFFKKRLQNVKKAIDIYA